MSELSSSLWDRAREAIRISKYVLKIGPDTAGSRAYYAAFYAVSAYFALQDRTFKKHSAVEVSVHRDLVKTGLWPKELGAGYSVLAELRTVGDYGDLDHITPDEAKEAIQNAGDILKAIAALAPDEFTGLDEI